MELPARASGDQLLPRGELTDIRARLRRVAGRHDLATVIACAFDHRTRMLPFILADTKMAPAGVRAVGSELLDAGFEKTRIVLQQWNRNFRPSAARLDGRVPDLLLVSSMQMHWQRSMEMIHDACRIDPGHRPLIVAGGPKCIYEPWDVFNTDPRGRGGADVAVTGEAYVLLSLLEALLSVRSPGESMRAAFHRARREGVLDGIPGLVYPVGKTDGVAEELVDTGIQRLVSDLDELAGPGPGYRILEPPGRGKGLALRPVEAARIRRISPISSIVLTLGCKFNCPYCPIPAYNQRLHRVKSGRRIADEIEQLYAEFHLQYYFGADDNFFNDQARALEILGELARRARAGSRAGRKLRLSTEVTIHDTLKMADHLPLARQAGMRALWLGVEDMTATLVKKGQSVDKTIQAFGLLRDNGILPMPMIMHYDSQPLYTPGRPHGLLNQARILRKAGAINLQALMITPSPGSKLFEETFTGGLAYESAGGRRVEQYMIDGNHVVASRHPRPWVKQMSLLIVYAYFFNPIRFLVALVHPVARVTMNHRWPDSRPRRWFQRFSETVRDYLFDAGAQLYGMYGLWHTVRRTFP
ncbi:MAG: radical SAM protein, partial [Planctomycetota bacterium]|nr:radical SAM protein [Planctomycetota bacterium]